ncbi:MAG TPA: hypothetical protein VMJ64_08680, partial [Anaerolineales bacterium]|nr:hypothetical protein [Anaerolineales bacterium]
ILPPRGVILTAYEENMKRSLKIAFVLTASGLLVGCALPSIALPGSAGPTLTPAPAYTDTALPAATATAIPPSETPAVETATVTAAPTQIPGTPVNYDRLSLVIPPGLATGTTDRTTTDYEFPYMNAGQGDMPQHLKLVLDGYPVQGTLLEPQIIVFPADQYTQYAPLTGQIVSTLRDVPFMDGQPLPPGLPSGPFNAHVGTVKFANGNGLRYLTQFDQAPLPANNQELIYYFHGLTDDGSAYVEAVLPITAAYLPADNKQDTPLPAGGVPFDMNDLGSYFQNISDKLNATPPNGFTPSLDTLDALMQSISVK